MPYAVIKLSQRLVLLVRMEVGAERRASGQLSHGDVFLNLY